MKFIDLTGQRFGRWTVLHRLPYKVGGTPFMCRCDCGTEQAVLSSALRNTQTTNCGCYQRERLRELHTTHGATRTGSHGKPSVEYMTWARMKARCESPDDTSYERYGARGISVCEKWRHDFPAFLRDMGPRPSPQHSIERKDNSGNYEPDNCRWATRIEQANNKRNNVHIEINGQHMTVAQAARHLGIGYVKLWKRLDSGMSLERASQTFLRARDQRSPRS